MHLCQKYFSYHTSHNLQHQKNEDNIKRNKNYKILGHKHPWMDCAFKMNSIDGTIKFFWCTSQFSRMMLFILNANTSSMPYTMQLACDLNRAIFIGTHSSPRMISKIVVDPFQLRIFYDSMIIERRCSWPNSHPFRACWGSLAIPSAWPKGQSTALFGSDRASIHGSFQTELSGSQFMKTTTKNSL